MPRKKPLRPGLSNRDGCTEPLKAEAGRVEEKPLTHAKPREPGVLAGKLETAPDFDELPMDMATVLGAKAGKSSPPPGRRGV